MRTLLSFLFSRLKQPQLSQPFLTGKIFAFLRGLSLDSLQYVHASLVLWSPELDTVLQVCLHHYCVERKDHLLLPGGLCMTQPRIPLVFTARTHCWLMSSLVFSGTCRFSCAKLLSSGQIPTRTGAWACSSPGAGLYNFPCWAPWGSCQLALPACQGSFVQQHNPAVYQPLLLVLCRLQTHWGYTLLYHPGH